MQKPNHTVLDVIERYFGAEAGPDLLAASRDASDEALRGLRAELENLPVVGAVPPLDDGELRPYLFQAEADRTVFIGVKPLGPTRQQVRDMLLLCHSVAFDDLVAGAFTYGRMSRSMVLGHIEVVSELAPLIREGVVVLVPRGARPVDDPESTPLLDSVRRMFDRESEIGAQLRAEMQARLRQRALVPGADALSRNEDWQRLEADMGAMTVSQDLETVVRNGRRVPNTTYWLPRRSYLGHLRLAAQGIAAMYATPSSRHEAARALARLDLPEFRDFDYCDLAEIRAHEDIFERWREVVTDAALAADRSSTPTAEFLGVLDDGVMRLRRELRGTRPRYVTGALRSFGLGVVGAISASAALGGAPAKALISGAVSAGGDALLRWRADTQKTEHVESMVDRLFAVTAGRTADPSTSNGDP